jgi:Na+-translocating ferredoxin:NAD+ oxidoreductase subunit B
MSMSPYKQLAERLDALPNGFPPTEKGAELRLLEKLFTPQEADLTAQLRLTPETPQELSERLGRDRREVMGLLRDMTRKGLLNVVREDGRLAYGILAFVVGIYENQAGTIDEELARLFEEYYHQAFGGTLTAQPSVHRVIPIGETVKMDTEIRPYESAADIVSGAKAWGVTECICRKQKALIGDPCDHPLEVCMVMAQEAGVFDSSKTIRALDQDEAMGVLKIASDAGLVHSVSNNQQGLWYICNCCTCSCGILRGMKDLGVANVVAASAFINQVDEDLCIACEACIDTCQFDALAMGETVVQVNQLRCVGCGVCVPACPEGALSLVRRPEEDVPKTPVTYQEWMEGRAAEREIDIQDVI